ncbi:MAG: tRNA 2-thiouridine(34) synthase MnmA [Planctomycetes bacterium]|nr:tRNA 2-thiouridine(34) synthase MnmA [Planctomycetota bacterium]
MSSGEMAVLLSGGVDSSLALALIRAEVGRSVTAYYLKIWLEDELSFLGSCPWEEDLGYARAVSSRLGVPLEIISLQQEYRELVVEHALTELKAGRTPSPDIWCNQHIKFGMFYSKLGNESTQVASGHYARVELREGRHRLLRSPDPVKDQTYFLSALSGEQLARAHFPIGTFQKGEVRRRAAELGLESSARKDSQGICFLGKISFREFVRHHLGERKGWIVDVESGKKLGEHEGYWFHTIGQRHGLGLGGGPWFVESKDTEENIVFVTHQERKIQHERHSFTTEAPHWIAGEPALGRVLVRIRHGPHLEGGTLSPAPGGGLEVHLDAPDQGVAPGQWAVFYRGEECLGSAVIAV